jgi:hypothetical protein
MALGPGSMSRALLTICLVACSGAPDSTLFDTPLPTLPILSDAGSVQLDPPTFDPSNGSEFPGTSANVIIRCDFVGAGMIVNGAYLPGQPSLPPSVGYLVTKTHPSVTAECTDRTGPLEDSAMVTVSYAFAGDAGR